MLCHSRYCKLLMLVVEICSTRWWWPGKTETYRALITAWCFLTSVYSVGFLICTSSRCYWKSFVSSGLGAANGVDILQMWKLAANILDKRRRTENKGWSMLMGVEREAKNPSPSNFIVSPRILIHWILHTN